MWPAATVEVGGRRAGAGYVVVPSATRPRLVVPRRPRRVAAGALRQFKTTVGRKEQLRGAALSILCRAGAHDLLPDRLTIGDPGRSGIDTYLGEVLGREVHACLYIGPARAVRKPVLQLLDARGETFAFAKLGVDEFTDALVRSEAGIVRELAALPWRVVRVPEVLHAGSWNGHELLVQSALPPGPAPKDGDDLLHAAMTEVAGARGIGTAPLAGSSYARRIAERLDALPPGGHVAALRAQLAVLLGAGGDTVLDFGSSHGDWTPWNMAVTRGGGTAVWDWEKFEPDVPVGLDAVHYSVQGRVVVDGAGPVDAFAATLAGAETLLRLPAARADLVVGLYAVDIASRFLADREEEAGHTRMSALDGWLRPVLDRVRERLAAPS